MSEEKVRCVQEWNPPRNLRDSQSFIGFANFYRRFIRDFSRIAKPITASHSLPENQWSWTPEMQRAFDKLKAVSREAPVLIHADPTKPFHLFTHASDYALGAVLNQEGDDGRLHPVGYHSRKMAPAEINYEIHDKELLAIVDAFKKWRRYLEGAPHTAQVYSDHNNHRYFLTSKVLNRRQTRWAQELAGYDFVINYILGKKNIPADTLSRREQDRPEKGGSEDQPIATVSALVARGKADESLFRASPTSFGLSF